MFFKKEKKEEPAIAIVSTCGGFAIRKKDILCDYKYLEAEKGKSDWWSANFKAEYCIFESPEEAKKKFISIQDVVIEYL